MNLLSTVVNAATGQLDGVSPDKLAEGLTKSPLAWGCVILLIMLVASTVFLVKALMASYEARIALMEKMYDLLLSTHTGTVTLGLEFTKGLDVMDKAIDFAQKRERENS